MISANNVTLRVGKKASIYTSIYGRKGILIDKKASCISVRKPLFFRNEKDIINYGRQKDIDSGKEENYGDKKSYNRT